MFVVVVVAAVCVTGAYLVGVAHGGRVVARRRHPSWPQQHPFRDGDL